jgi:membrane protease subunit HflC
VVRNAFQEEINRRTVRELLSSKRETLMADVKREVLETVRGSSPGVSTSSMCASPAWTMPRPSPSPSIAVWRPSASAWPTSCAPRARLKVKRFRAEADRQRDITIANAYRDAQKIKGEGDAEAARVYAEAFGKDPQFAQFYRSLDAYKESFSKKSDVLVL